MVGKEGVVGVGMALWWKWSWKRVVVSREVNRLNSALTCRPLVAGSCHVGRHPSHGAL